MEGRLAVLSCLLMCFRTEGKDTPGIVLKFPPIVVALRGENLQFNLKVSVPKNQSSEEISCRCAKCKTWIHKKEVPSHVEEFRDIVLLKAFNSSVSGEYSCRYKTAKVYWVVLVRDEGYREPSSDHLIVICVGSLTGGLFLFSLIGSTLLFKDCRFCPTGSEDNGEGKEGDGKVKDESSGHPANDGSVYTDLEDGASSVYNVLQTATPAKKPDLKLVERRATKEASKMRKTGKDEDADESVYENY